MVETLRTAVIGVGSMGKNHARVFSELQESELVGVADVNRERAEQVGKKYGANWYTDYREMLEKERPEAVVIAVPTKYHAAVAEDTVEYADILVEKPIADTIEAGKRIINAAREHERVLMVGQIERFNPAVEYLMDWVKKRGAKYLSFDIVRAGLPLEKGRQIETSVIVDLGIHDIDIVRYLTGERIVAVSAKKMNVIRKDHYDHAHIWLEMENSSASIVTNWVSPRKIRHMYVTTTEGFLYLNYITQEISIFSRNGENDPRLLWEPEKRINLRFEEPLKRELAHFLRCVRTRETPVVTGEDALESLRIALMAEGER